MAPMVMEPVPQAGLQHLIPSQKGINLSMLIDFLLQKTYHDLTVLSELLPRKSDIERKIEIIQFATKARQQFIRLLALVKWASSADRVDKCQAISSLLDQQNAYFIDTADTLARIARETLVQARLPNFSLPTAVDVLTTGTFNRLPKCIKTKIIPDDPISAPDKTRTLKRLNEAIQHRLVISKVPPEFTSIQIGDGKVHLKVEHEFEVILMLMGVESDIPWRLLNIEFLMEDYETGDGKSLVHGMQIHYIHQIVQSRLMIEDNPLVDLFNTLHYFCVSLQLEILHTQCKRLIMERWGEHVKIEEYVPGQKLVVSYCRLKTGLQKDASPSPAISILFEKNSLLLCHVPELKHEVVTDNDSGVVLASNCLSIEKIFSVVIKQFALSILKNLLITLTAMPYYKDSVSLDVSYPCVNIKPFLNCTCNEVVSISMDSRSGVLVLNVSDKIKPKYVQQLQALLQADIVKFASDFHLLRCVLYVERCRRSVTLLPVHIHNILPITNYATHQLSKLPNTKLYLQFKKYMKYCMVVVVDVDHSNPSKPLIEKYYLFKVSKDRNQSTNAEQAELNFSLFAEPLIRLNVGAFHQLKSQSKKKEKKRNSDLYKRKKLLDDVKVMNIRKKLKGGKDTSLPVPKEFESTDSSLNITISTVVASSYMRVPFIELTEQLSTSKFIFTGVREEDDMDFVLRILSIPKPSDCDVADALSLSKLLMDCAVRMDHELNQWKVCYTFSPPQIPSCSQLHHRDVTFTYKHIVNEEENKELGIAILNDWKALIQMYKYAKDIDNILLGLATVSGVEDLILLKYDMKSLVFTYTKDKNYLVTFSYDSDNSKYTINFTEIGASRDKCPHHLTQIQLMNEFNQHGNLQYIIKIIYDTYSPLQSIASISILPALGISNRVLSVVNNFTIIAHSSTHVKIIYRNIYILDVYFMEHTVLIRDGTFYRTDSTKAMRGFTTILQLASFLQLFVDKMQPSNLFLGHDFPVTPGGTEFETQTEHFGPATQERAASAHISSPSQFTSPSPGNPYSVPSPGTFLQPSPAPANLSAMSPSAWPGSPPLVQGSPRPGKQGLNTSQNRQLLSSINVSHAPVPVVLTHSGFKMLMTPVATKKVTKLCPLEKFFGSVLLRAHLLRVLRTDDTLKLEKQEHGVVIFSGTGKNGPNSGLQYSVRLNPTTMDSLILKITPMKGHENTWSADDLKVLEQFFELKVVCSLYKVCALTAFARILGTQPKLMKDFIRIMRLELQTDWSSYLFRVEWCLTVPPGDMPTIALPGTPAVVLKTKNLIFLQLTDVKNEENRVTITLVHDLKTNTVQLLEFPKLAPNAPPEPVTWAVRARQCLKTLLQRISEQISKKECPIYCAVYTVLKNMHVK